MSKTKDPTPSSDRPIVNKRADQLGRSRFAEELAKSIGAWSGKDSLVVSLEGIWGCGKTSVKNLVVEALKKGGKRKAIQGVCEFAPWEFSGEDKITHAFFEALADSLDDTEIPDTIEKLKKKIRKYGSLVENGTSFLESAAKDTWWEFPVALFVSWTKGFFDNSASKLKSELSGALASLKRPILVVIDDIDRLTDEEIALLFRLIKCNADFPNLVYLLLFDRGYVEDSLDVLLPKPRGDEGRGAEYLKKIVQVSYTVPEPERKQLEQILFNGLDEILKDVNALTQFDKERWNFIFPDGVRPFFKTVRDVNRFLSSLSFYAGVFEGESTFEVDPIDLIALELLRVFEADVYSVVAASKETLLPLTSFIKMDEDRQTDADYVEREIIGIASPKNKEAVSSLLNTLFPHVSEIRHERVRNQGTFEDWFQARRVCEADFFDQYFGLHFGVNHLSASELQHFLAHLHNPDEIEKQMLAFKQRGKLPLLLDALENYKNKLPLDNFPALAVALMNIGDELPQRGIGLFGEDPRMSCTRVILFMLSRVGEEQKRFTLLKDAINEARSFAVAAHVVHLLRALSKENGWGNLGKLFSDENKIRELCEHVTDRIDDAARGNKLECSPRIAPVVDFWHQHKKDDYSKQWLAQEAQDPKKALPILKSFMRSGSRSDKDKVGWRISFHELTEYIPLEVIDKSVDEIEPAGESDKLVIQAYRLTKEKGRETLPPFAGDDDRYVWSDITDLY